MSRRTRQSRPSASRSSAPLERGEIEIEDAASKLAALDGQTDD